MTILSGPMFEPARHAGMKSVSGKRGAHYNVFYLDSNPADRVDPEVGMASLRSLFPEGQADDMNFVLFSTSGVHGTYITIEEIEAALTKYGDDGPDDPDAVDDWTNRLTVLVVHPRIVCLRCGVVRVRLADLPWLKKLRQTSWDAVRKIGAWT